MNPQEQFWRSEFGLNYQARNVGSSLVAANTALFSRILRRTPGVKSVLEFGAGVGNNLDAIRQLLPDAWIAGVEINDAAFAVLQSKFERSMNYSILEMDIADTVDFVLTKGLLIHIAPEDLPRAYEVLFRNSNRYICVAEYYDPKPTEIEYRGHKGKLWKRDFAGEMMDLFPLRLIDCGFVYHREEFGLDDLTWFLMEKK